MGGGGSYCAFEFARDFTLTTTDNVKHLGSLTNAVSGRNLEQPRPR